MLLQFPLTPGTPLTITGTDILSSVFKILLLAVSVLYILFAILVVREIGLMRKSVTVPDTGSVVLISFLHLVLAVLLFLFFLLIL